MKSTFLITCILIVLALLQSCGSLLSDSKNTVIIETLNWEKSHKLSLFVKKGGATVGNSYQISILPTNKNIAETDVGNVFIADDHDGSISEDTSRVRLRWIDNVTAIIIFDKRLRVFKSETKINSLTVVYDTISLQR